MLYSIALEISPTPKVAEEVLISTFLKIDEQKSALQNHPSLCVSLIKLVIQTAHEQFSPGQLKNNFKLQFLENTPLLHEFLCEKISVSKYCEENRLSRSEVAKKFREELISLRNYKKEGESGNLKNKSRIRAR